MHEIILLIKDIMLTNRKFFHNSIYIFSIAGIIPADGSVTELICEQPTHVCLNKTIRCTCRISNGIITWRVPQKGVEIDFFAVTCEGVSRSHKGFTATLTLVHNGRTSVLDIPALESLSGTDLKVVCEDVFDGNEQRTNLTIATHAGELEVELYCSGIGRRWAGGA